MEGSSRVEMPSGARDILEAQLRESYGRVVYSHKTHEKCADILLGRLSAIKLWQIGLSALTTGGFISVLFGAGRVGVIVGATVSTLLLVLNAYTKNYDLGESAQKHRQVAAALWLIRERYLSLLTDLAMGMKPLDQLLGARDQLLEDLHPVYESAPSTTPKAYSCAQQALKCLGDMTFSDEEIDAMLPKQLRRSVLDRSADH